MEKKRGIELCICTMCPSYIACEEEIAYCLAVSGKSTCIREEQGCLCPGCPVREEEGFSHVYFCIRGSETEQLPAR
jgi:hypothetical protein